MQFQVPQFIEVEDKIFGPLTFRQFIYVIGSAGLAYMMWRVAPTFIAAPIAIIILGMGAALAFFQWNGRPFIVALENGFFYFLRSKLYLWNNERKTATPMKTPAQTGSGIYVPKLSQSRLHELAWSLDINERIAAGIVSDAERESSATQAELVAPVRTARSALSR